MYHMYPQVFVPGSPRRGAVFSLWNNIFLAVPSFRAVYLQVPGLPPREGGLQKVWGSRVQDLVLRI